MAHDAFEFEMITSAGNHRVIDTSGFGKASRGPALLQWSLDVQEASGMR
jgi:hypothetical protein